jgi:hypothetical protein
MRVEAWKMPASLAGINVKREVVATLEMFPNDHKMGRYYDGTLFSAILPLVCG